ncbi:hypothetical protein AAK964_09630 [Tissierella praeacuta]|uniref:hypothetical protein n=1 Tax=Tissierella praeacuta TaxID=43131 RepID=UPI0028A7C023|nr:hypothetical protein [Tissierella praeacuta]
MDFVDILVLIKDVGGHYVAKKAGEAATYLVENSQTKYVRINNGTYFNAGITGKWSVLLGSGEGKYKARSYVKSADYDKSNDYFLDRALESFI